MPEALVWYRSHVSDPESEGRKGEPVASFWVCLRASLCANQRSCTNAHFSALAPGSLHLLSKGSALLGNFSHIPEKKPDAQKGRVSVHLAFSLLVSCAPCVCVRASKHRAEPQLPFCPEAHLTLDSTPTKPREWKWSLVTHLLRKEEPRKLLN